LRKVSLGLWSFGVEQIETISSIQRRILLGFGVITPDFGKRSFDSVVELSLGNLQVHTGVLLVSSCLDVVLKSAGSQILNRNL